MTDPITPPPWSQIVTHRIGEIITKGEPLNDGQKLALVMGIAREAYEAGDRHGFDRGYLTATEQQTRVQMLLSDCLGAA